MTALGAVAAGLCAFAWFAPVRSRRRAHRPRWVWLATSCGAAVMVAAPTALAVGAAVVLVVVGIRRRRVQPHDERSVPLADVVDLLALAASSGCSPAQALRESAQVLRPRQAAFDQAVRELDAGERLSVVLDRLRESVGPTSAPLVAALVSAADFGTPMAPALALVAHDLRLTARRNAELEARRVPIKLLFPLVLCILPAFVLLSIVPLLLATVADLGA